jgi:DNA-binding CsgD family transcriptional regulator
MSTQRGYFRNGPLVPSAAGLILVDGSRIPIYYNAEAIEILSYPEQLKNQDAFRSLLPYEIRELLHRKQHGERRISEFMSGRRHYVCRVFNLREHSRTSARTIIGLLLERSAPKPVNISQAAAQFHLTGREQETVAFLTLGLTSKEIASRMNISPNTVKTLCRLVMAKMAVSTRSGIVGKLAQI